MQWTWEDSPQCDTNPYIYHIGEWWKLANCSGIVVSGQQWILGETGTKHVKKGAFSGDTYVRGGSAD